MKYKMLIIVDGSFYQRFIWKSNTINKIDKFTIDTDSVGGNMLDNTYMFDVLL